jgi:Icc-related predicted phosphoesterase
MKIVAISDTHGYHTKLKVPDGDILIHTGDVSSQGKEFEIILFLNWFAEQPHKHKVFIAGNHDFYFERTPTSDVNKIIPDNVTYLNDSGVTVEGIRIWGSPIQPWFYDWAFNRQRGMEIKKHWDMIPENTDILMTHGPAYGILDATTRGEKVGCRDLREAIERVQPKLFVCGHIHEAYGILDNGQTTFVNASVVNFNYQVVNKPIVFDWKK